MESDFHKQMKDSVSHELAVEGYSMHLEPFDPPLERLSWNCFRPDILGVKNGESKLRVVFAECETKPNISRVKGKTKQVRQVVLQTSLNEKYDLRLILAVPCGTLSKVNYTQFRRLWEIWLINRKGRIIYKVT